MLVVDDKHGSNDFNESEVDDLVSDLWKKNSKRKSETWYCERRSGRRWSKMERQTQHHYLYFTQAIYMQCLIYSLLVLF